MNGDLPYQTRHTSSAEKKNLGHCIVINGPKHQQPGKNPQTTASQMQIPDLNQRSSPHSRSLPIVFSDQFLSFHVFSATEVQPHEFQIQTQSRKINAGTPRHQHLLQHPFALLLKFSAICSIESSSPARFFGQPSGRLFTVLPTHHPLKADVAILDTGMISLQIDWPGPKRMRMNGACCRATYRLIINHKHVV